MKLMTKELQKKLPALYEQDGKGDKAMVYAHYFLGGCDWFVTEFDGEDTMFGFVCLNNDKDMAELGYISLSELESVLVKGMKIERDLYWSPKPLGDVKELYDFK